jgi:hypothetical protein
MERELDQIPLALDTQTKFDLVNRLNKTSHIGIPSPFIQGEWGCDKGVPVSHPGPRKGKGRYRFRPDRNNASLERSGNFHCDEVL